MIKRHNAPAQWPNTCALQHWFLQKAFPTAQCCRANQAHSRVPIGLCIVDFDRFAAGPFTLGRYCWCKIASTTPWWFCNDCEFMSRASGICDAFTEAGAATICNLTQVFKYFCSNLWRFSSWSRVPPLQVQCPSGTCVFCWVDIFQSHIHAANNLSRYSFDLQFCFSNTWCCSGANQFCMVPDLSLLICSVKNWHAWFRHCKGLVLELRSTYFAPKVQSGQTVLPSLT